ncbi:hypothetical protein BRETT_000919 [Brettanomyces bruxellensis]|uniref:C2H2-type domain-containing protein n=1 Tax=Dekkera bruxellensis TaxID=5007 RepID=A0A871RBN7_DEKBR|nr:uncharacterized protein BRETT_000919 [Brettanomyces bruxellensis]QOU21198.1 hypothetical protein BRETT_000919 [Brettanomyces bruxellensis]
MSQDTRNNTSINDDGGSSSKDRPEDIQRLLIEILNSQKPKASPNAQTKLLNTHITNEDVSFIKAANDVVKLHQYRVDPTIRDILSRLQYTHPSPGNTPHSKDYLQALGLGSHILADRINSPDNNTYNPNQNSTQAGPLRDWHSILSPLSPQTTALPTIAGQSSTANSIQVSGQTALPPLRNPTVQLPPLNGSNTTGRDTQTRISGQTNNQGELIGQLVHTIKNMNSSQQQNLVKGIAQMLLGSPTNSQVNTQSLTEKPSNMTSLAQRPQPQVQKPELQAQQIQFQPGGGDLGLQNFRTSPDASSTSILARGTSPISFDSHQNFSSSRAPNNNNGYSSQFVLETPTTNSMIRSYSSTSASSNTFNGRSEFYSGSKFNLKTNAKTRGGSHKNAGINSSRKFVCPKCGVAFKRSSDLKRHEKIHLPVPPNICPLCKTGFARKDALKRHIDTMTCRRNRKRLLESLKKKKTSQSNDAASHS